MKKLLLFIAGIGVLMFASCGKPEPTTLDRATSFPDSINIGLGQYLGALANKEISLHPELSKDEAIEGILYVMSTDTTDHSRFFGIDMGLNLLDFFRKDVAGAPVSIDTFLANFEKRFKANSAFTDIQELQHRYDRTMAMADSARRLHSENPTVKAAALSPALCDSLSRVLGEYYGEIGRNELRRLPHTVDSSALMEQIRVMCNTDTANQSYISGLKTGIAIYNYYHDQANRVGSGSRSQFVSALKRTLDLDSVDSEMLNQLKATLDPMTERSYRMMQERMEADIFDSREAKENRMLSDAVAAKLIGNPDYSAVGNDGLMMRQLVPGDGMVLASDTEVRVDVTARRIDSGAEIFSRIGVRMLMGNPRDVMLMNILPLMQMGETAEFFVPYTLAYGTIGSERIGVGPCESLMVTISIKPL